MGKYRTPERLSRSDTKSMDYKARKRIEELYLLTDEILNEQNNKNYKYDYKLYKKYKQLKEINKKLQEKIINQHCSGCKCHSQSNVDTDTSVPFIDLTSSTSKKDKKKNVSTDTNRKTEASSEEEEEEEEEEQMDTNDDVVVEEEKEEGDELAGLPSILQDIIRNKVKESNNENEYLLKIGLCPSLCELLCRTSGNLIGCLSTEKHIIPLLPSSKCSRGKTFKKKAALIRTEIREIHQLYVLAVAHDREKEKSNTNGKKEHQRTSV